MKRITMTATVAVAALAMSAIMSAGALASGPALVLKHGGTAVNTPSKAVGFLVVGSAPAECDVATEGTLSKNSKSKDEAKFATALLDACEEPGYTITGTVSEAKMNVSGTAEYTMKDMIYTEASGCAYAVKKGSYTFDPKEEYVFGSGSTSAKLKLPKGLSKEEEAKLKADCESPKTITIVGEVGPALLEPFETEEAA